MDVVQAIAILTKHVAVGAVRVDWVLPIHWYNAETNSVEHLT